MTEPVRLLLDTNIISDVMREKPDAVLLHWYMAQKLENMFLSSVTIGELWQGISQLAPTHAKLAFYRDSALFTEQRYHGRILSFDHETARLWGEMRGHSRRKGRPLPDLDSQIAAIALQHKMTLVTANTRHFQGLNIPLFNPKERK